MHTHTIGAPPAFHLGYDCSCAPPGVLLRTLVGANPAGHRRQPSRLAACLSGSSAAAKTDATTSRVRSTPPLQVRCTNLSRPVPQTPRDRTGLEHIAAHVLHHGVELSGLEQVRDIAALVRIILDLNREALRVERLAAVLQLPVPAQRLEQIDHPRMLVAIECDVRDLAAEVQRAPQEHGQVEVENVEADEP